MANVIERTFFYSLPAFGLYTAQVECLRSYIERLALAHLWMPRDLIKQLLTRSPFSEHTAATPVSITEDWAVHSGSAVNGGLMSRLVDATRQPLEATSMARLSHVLSTSDLLDRRGAERVRFCPLCFEEDLENGLEYPYGRLLWIFKAVTCCPLHGCHLQESSGCWKKEGRRLALQQRPRAMGICTDCGSIGRRCSHSSITMASAQEMSVARLMGQVVAMNGTECSTCTDESVRSGIREALERSFKGQYVPAAAASGLGRGTMHGWLQGTGKPGLASLARLAMVCNIDLSWMLRGQAKPLAATLSASELKLNFPRGYRRSEVNDAEVAQLLDEALSQKPVLSLAGLARKAGIRVERLSRKFPVQSQAIVAAYRKQVAQQREQSYAEAVNAFGVAASKLQSRGMLVTSRKLQEEAGTYVLSSNVLRGRALNEVLKSANFPTN